MVHRDAEGSPVAAVALYRRVLGDAFDAPLDVLRRFHDGTGGASAAGMLRVRRGEGRLRSLLAALLRLPAPGERVALRLRVTVERGRERWLRKFDGIRIATVQWARGGVLIEAVGPLRFGFRLVPHERGLRFEPARVWLYPFRCRPPSRCGSMPRSRHPARMPGLSRYALRRRLSGRCWPMKAR